MGEQCKPKAIGALWQGLDAASCIMVSRGVSVQVVDVAVPQVPDRLTAWGLEYCTSINPRKAQVCTTKISIGKGIGRS